MRSFLHIALALVALVLAVSAALDEFPKRTRTVQGPVDLNVKRVLRSRQLTREQLVARAKVRATRTGPKPRTISDTPRGKPFTIVNGPTTYRLDPATNTLVSAMGPGGRTQFQTSGSSSGTVTSTTGSAPLSFLAQATPNEVTAGGAGKTAIMCSTTMAAPGPGNNRFSLDCVYTSLTGTAPVYFCSQGTSTTVLASTAFCPTGYTPLNLVARFDS